jgi:hypothetical protein
MGEYSKKITVKTLKKGAESLGLKPAKIKDVDGGIEYIESFFKGEGAELDYECNTCGEDIPDVEICPFCADVLEEDEGGEDESKGEDPEEEEGGEDEGNEEETGDDGGDDVPDPEEEEEKPKKKTGGKKTVAKDKKKNKPKAKVKDTKKKAQAKDPGEGDKLRDLIVAALEKSPLVKKGVAKVNTGASRSSFWGPKGLIAKIFSVKGVAWMYLKDADKKLVKLGGSKLHIRELETAVKGLPTRWDLPSASEVKTAVKVLTGLVETQAEEAEKEEKKVPKKDKADKKAKKAKSDGKKKKTTKKKK